MEIQEHIRRLKEHPDTSAVGNRWSSEEEAQLLESVMNRKDIHLIAKEHKRTLGGIRSRIEVIALRMLAEGKSIEEVCQKLSITPTQIENAQLKRSSLNKSDEPVSGKGFDLLNQLREMIEQPGVGLPMKQDCDDILQRRIERLQSSLEGMMKMNEKLKATVALKNKEYFELHDKYTVMSRPVNQEMAKLKREIEDLRSIKLQHDALYDMYVRNKLPVHQEMAKLRKENDELRKELNNVEGKEFWL
jgi:superfamily I DNA/RNA helicase